MEVVGAGAGLGAEARSTGDGAGVGIVEMDNETIERYPFTLYTWQLYKIHSYSMLTLPGPRCGRIPCDLFTIQLSSP